MHTWMADTGPDYYCPPHLRTATIGVDPSGITDTTFTRFCNELGEWLFRIAGQAETSTILAEQKLQTQVRSIRITLPPTDRLLRRFLNGDRASTVRQRVGDLTCVLDSVAERISCHLREAFECSLQRSSLHRRLYSHQRPEKDFFIGGLGIDLRYGPTPFSIALMEALTTALGRTKRLFAFASLGEGPDSLAWEAVELIATQVKAMGTAGAKFAAGINLKPNTPFFPASFHRGGQPVLTVGMSGAGYLTKKVLSLRNKTRASIERAIADAECRSIWQSTLMGTSIASAITGCSFLGVDPSQAPEFRADHPGSNSIGALIETLSGVEVGCPGTKDAFGTIMAGLKTGAAESGMPLVGFGGEFLPVCEDDILALRASQKHLTITTLMDLTSICSAGIDMCILDRKTQTGQVAHIINDVVQSARHKQAPLAARLIIPEPTASFDAKGFCQLGGLLGSGPEMQVNGETL